MSELKNSYEVDIVNYAKASLENEKDFHFLQLEYLQRINIVHQQLKLVRTETKIQRDGHASTAKLDSLAEALRNYSMRPPTPFSRIVTTGHVFYSPVLATAIRDYEFLRQHKTPGDIDAVGSRVRLMSYFLCKADYKDPVDPFGSEYSVVESGDPKFDLLRRFFMRRLPVQFTYSAVEKDERTKEYSEGRPPNQVSTAVDRLVRLISSLTGAVFVLLPMFVMSIGPSRTKSLVTVSVGVVVFACVLSLGIRVSTLQTLIATTTYAAVLVVFVGSTSGDGGNAS
jgi:hypothetical protein